jgi:hypothetical protein
MKTHPNNSMCNRVSYIFENFKGLIGNGRKGSLFSMFKVMCKPKDSFSTPMGFCRYLD